MRFDLLKFFNVSKRMDSKYLCDICLSSDYPQDLVSWAQTKHVKKACKSCIDDIEKIRSNAMHKILHLVVKRNIDKMYFKGRKSEFFK
tara:strand:- start:266 stop:529 length:264 start_codon:yes stop_codon:yes gene_type:complete